MPDSPNLGLPYIVANQAQKHLPHNDALALIDGLLQLSVVARNATQPPTAAADGQRWLLGSSPGGDWAGHGGLIALFSAGAWIFLTPRKGWAAWIEAEACLLVYDGSTWVAPPAPTALQNMVQVGVNATADANNRLAVSSPGVLLNHAGAGLQLKLNKNGPGDTASLLMQTGWSGRAEMGTAGDDNFNIKVSADGSAWSEALVVDAATGLARAAGNPVDPLGLVTKQYADALAQASPSATGLGLIMARNLIIN